MKPNLITKEEEQRALQVISNKLVPAATKSFNIGVRRAQPLHLNEISEDEVRKNIKKKGRMKHGNSDRQSGYDMVRYEVKVNDDKFPIIFDINKSPGMLYVEWHHQFEAASNNRGGQRAVVYSDLREGVFDLVVPSIIREAADPGMRLTRKEDKAAFDFLIKVIIPKAVDDLYMKFIRKHPGQYTNERRYPRITATDIIKNVKKIRTDVDSATYESAINDHVFFTFFLKKGQVNVEPKYVGEKPRNENRLMFGASGPINQDWKWYPVTTV